ncbi:hypothetical protein scyTo_0003385 [Scyliorhinus torazame]|uniref:Uncharacterized protein n=1 Tax=Scyliorhinus torazame TaxID=75743 RepID=A0A401PME2_SCYTO|nr:hypothetical protein [Scyliorhinus torazame]
MATDSGTSTEFRLCMIACWKWVNSLETWESAARSCSCLCRSAWRIQRRILADATLSVCIQAPRKVFRVSTFEM